MQRLIDGDRASRRERYALGTDGLPFIGQPSDPEQHEGAVLASHCFRGPRIGAHPVTDALRRDLLARDDVALDENAADRYERVAIMSIVVDAQYGPVL